MGSIVATQKETSLVGKKLMIIQPVNHKGDSLKQEEVACDAVGAGIGEYVLVTKGHGARTAFEPKDSVIDLSIVAIIDRFE